MRKLVFFGLLVFNVFLAKSQSDSEIESTLQKYRQCLLASNPELIPEITSDEFRLGVYQQPISNELFTKFIKLGQAPDSIHWSSIEGENLKRHCTVHYFKGDRKISSELFFSENGKLLFSDWLDQQGLGFLRRAVSSYVTSIPFQFDQNKIIISAKLNEADTTLNFLFDTGADGMALRTDLQARCGVKITRSHTANIPGGQMATKLSENNRLVFDSLTIPGQNLVLFDYMGKGIDGIIGGSNLFRQFITEVDFDEHVIRLYKHGGFLPPPSYKSCSMTYANGVPTVAITIYKGNRHFQSEFIFDTGAGYEAILFGSGMKQLEKDSIDRAIPALYHTVNYSVGHQADIAIGIADSVQFANRAFTNLNLGMEPYNEANHGRHNVLGSIGIKTLSRFNWIVDLTAYKIYTRSNKRSSLPMDFSLNGRLYGYVGDKLYVTRVLTDRKDQPGDSVALWDCVLEIDGTTPSELTKERLMLLMEKKQIPLKVLRRGEVRMIVEENPPIAPN